MQEIKKLRRDKEAYMQNVLEATHRDSAFTYSIKFVVKISKCYRTPVKCDHSI